jgi:hypothetical protein
MGMRSSTIAHPHVQQIMLLNWRCCRDHTVVDDEGEKTLLCRGWEQCQRWWDIHVCSSKRNPTLDLKPHEVSALEADFKAKKQGWHG